jgi:hypothetical protein
LASARFTARAFSNLCGEKRKTRTPLEIDEGATPIAGKMVINSTRPNPAAHLSLLWHSFAQRAMRRVSQIARAWPSRTSMFQPELSRLSLFGSSAPDRRRPVVTIALLSSP